MPLSPRYYRYAPEQGDWVGFAPPPPLLYNEVTHVAGSPRGGGRQGGGPSPPDEPSPRRKFTRKTFPPAVFSEEKCEKVLTMPMPIDTGSPAYHACVRAKRLARQELRMFRTDHTHREKRASQNRDHRVNRLEQIEKQRQVEGYMARARQNRIQASRERNQAIKNQVLAEELSFQAEQDQARHAHALDHARQDTVRYHDKLEQGFRDIEQGKFDDQEALAQAREHKKHRDMMAARYEKRRYKLPAIVSPRPASLSQSPRESPREPTGGGRGGSPRKPQWDFPSRHSRIAAAH